MPGICPYCNGMIALRQPCPRCAAPLTDGGRLDDYAGPYAPYRQIDDLKLTNGYPDLARQLCVHQTYCQECGYSAALPMQEQ